MKMQSRVSIVPVYMEACEDSVLLTQILYGETCDIMENHGKFVKIKHDFDGTEGFVNAKMLASANVTKKEILSDPYSFQLTQYGYFLLSAGSEISNDYHNPQKAPSAISDYALQFLNVPEIKGGRSFFGIDSSGFIQLVFKLYGFALPRFAAQQAEMGNVLDFINEGEEGDLAFFEDEVGNINHVGMLLHTGEIIHCYGMVRVDLLDSAGIFNRELKKHTHTLRYLKRLTKVQPKSI